MTRNWKFATALIVLASLLAFSWAHGRGILNADEPKAGMHDIALVDINKIYARHQSFVDQADELKREAQRTQEELKAGLEKVKELTEELKSHKAGTAQHDRIQKELKERGAEWQKASEEARKRLDEKQATMTLSILKSINETIQRTAEARGIKLVLNYSSQPLDLKNIRTQSGNYVLYQGGLDITDDVLQALN